ncbi:MAG: HAD family hydrolase [Bryobacteraceae bacterium]
MDLIVDADDTLWENNVYFERAFEDFVAYLEHSTLNAAEIRAILDEIEVANARLHGYGSLNFGRNLQQCYVKLAEREIGAQDLETVKGFALRILEQPLEIIAGVEETLGYLAGRHELTLFTKGHVDEQKMKIERSGLGKFFAHTAIVKEKDVASYRQLASERGMDPRAAWMIGNSPKSDINPALEAGLNAVFIPHARTWTLERQELRAPGPGRLLVLRSFADLRGVF